MSQYLSFLGNELVERFLAGNTTGIEPVKLYENMLDIALFLAILVFLVFLCYIYFQKIQKQCWNSKQICSLMPLKLLTSYRYLADCVESIMLSI